MLTLSEWPVSLESYCRIRSKWTAPVPLWWLLYYLQCGQLHFPSGGPRTCTMWTAPFSLWWLLKYLHNVDSSIFPLVAPQVLTQCGQLHFPSGGSSSTYTMWTAPFSLWGLFEFRLQTHQMVCAGTRVAQYDLSTLLAHLTVVLMLRLENNRQNTDMEAMETSMPLSFKP